MEKNLTELVFILDRSGSMAGLESDTIGGFNGLINQQKNKNGECLVSVTLFDNVSELIFDRVSLKNINPMTENDYTVRGCTALLDAVGDEIKRVEFIHKYIREEDKPEHTIFVITTDGMENASHKYILPQIKTMIEEKRKNGWQFLFLGANIDASETASSMGISKECAADYHADSMGTAAVYEALSDAVCCFRDNGSVGKNWKIKVDKDYKSRK